MTTRLEMVPCALCLGVRLQNELGRETNTEANPGSNAPIELLNAEPRL